MPRLGLFGIFFVASDVILQFIAQLGAILSRLAAGTFGDGVFVKFALQLEIERLDFFPNFGKVDRRRGLRDPRAGNLVKSEFWGSRVPSSFYSARKSYRQQPYAQRRAFSSRRVSKPCRTSASNSSAPERVLARLRDKCSACWFQSGAFR